MAFAKIRQGKIYYEIHGTGEPIVLIRGLGRWSEHWNDFHLELAKTHRVIIYDGRGLGRSTVRLRPWHSMRDLGDDIVAILKTERIDAAHLVGVSLGGMIALQFAADHPEMTLSTTAVNASTGRSGHRRISLEATKLLLQAPRLKDKLYPKLAELLTASNCPGDLQAAMAQRWLEIDQQYPQPTATVIQQLAIALRWKNWPQLTKISRPIQIILSEDDLFVPRGNSLFLAAKLPKTKLTKLTNAGHEPHIDQRQPFLNAIRSFVAEIA